MNCNSIEPKKLNFFWKVEDRGQVRVEMLFVDDLLAEENYYSNGKIDSFRIIDRGNTAAYFDELSTKDQIDSVWAFFVKEAKTKDSIEITFWLPLEKGKIYQYGFYRNSQLIHNHHAVNSPLLNLKFKILDDKDTSNQLFEVEKITLSGKKIKTKVRRKLMMVKNGVVDYHLDHP